jgi:hypothetical protein
MHYLLVIAILSQLTQVNAPKTNGMASKDSPTRVELSAISLPDMALQGTTLETFTKVVTQTGLSGGIIQVFDDCSKGLQKPLTISEGTSLTQALDMVAGNDTREDWRVSAGIINMIPASNTLPPLLQVQIHGFKWDKTAPLRETILALVNSQEVTEKALQLGLKKADFEGAASAICIRNCSLNEKPKPSIIVEPDSTLLALLNRVIQAHDHSVWSYRENNCSGKSTFMLEVIAD